MPDNSAILDIKSTDKGKNWKSIAGDIPENHLIWRIVQDYVKPELMFLATEYGVFFTIDGLANQHRVI